MPLVGAALIGACNLSARALSWHIPTDRPALERIEPVGRLGAVAISESSGLTPSGIAAGLYWTHNDSGHDPRLYAIEPNGALRGTVLLPEAVNTDWEAIASGPCPSGSCLFIGDVGDNLGTRDRVTIWRVPEPVLDRGAPATVPLPVTRLDVRYADGPRDVEAMYVAPDTSLWVITKRPLHRWLPSRDPVRLFRVPAAAWSRGGLVTAVRAGSLPIVPGQLSVREWVTDAALSHPRADGTRRLAVLTYGSVQVFATEAGTGRPGRRIGRCSLPIEEHDSEAVAWLPDGRVLITNEGERSLLYAGACGGY